MMPPPKPPSPWQSFTPPAIFGGGGAPSGGAQGFSTPSLPPAMSNDSNPSTPHSAHPIPFGQPQLNASSNNQSPQQLQASTLFGTPRAPPPPFGGLYIPPVRRRPPVEVGALSCLQQLQQLQVQEKKRSIILIPPPARSSQMYWILLLLRGRIVARPNKAGRYVLLYVRSPTRRGSITVCSHARARVRERVLKREKCYEK